MQFIKYVGTAHVRMITADEFRLAGFPDMETKSWNFANNHAVPIDDFPGDVLEKVITPDPFLIVVGGKEHEPRNLGYPMTPGQAAGPRIDMTGAMRAETPSAGLSGRSEQGFTGSGPTPGGGGSTPTTVTTGPGSTTDS